MPHEPYNAAALLQSQLLQKTEALQIALAEGKPIQEIKALFTECSLLYDELIKIKSESPKNE